MWAEVDESRLDRGAPAYEHVTVMRNEAVELLAPRPAGVYVDATVGGGGHTEALLQAAPDTTVVGIDRDPRALEAAQERLRGYGSRVRLLRGSFGEMPQLLRQAGIGRVHGVLADLGLSSAQLAARDRGMSFRLEGPLDMRMDPDAQDTALDLIEQLSQDELANVIYRYGEERRSRRVARCIKQALSEGRLQTTLDLRRAIVRAVGPSLVGGVDPATRTFQALRIAVNGELDQLQALLEQAPAVLVRGGILAIISFHSLEDRAVKRAFQLSTRWTRLTKKPLVASATEVETNARARSAKLRAAQLLEEEELDDEAGQP